MEHDLGFSSEGDNVSFEALDNHSSPKCYQSVWIEYLPMDWSLLMCPEWAWASRMLLKTTPLLFSESERRTRKVVGRSPAPP